MTRRLVGVNGSKPFGVMLAMYIYHSPRSAGSLAVPSTCVFNSLPGKSAGRCCGLSPIASFTEVMAAYRGAALSDVHVGSSKAHLDPQGGSGFVP